MATIGQALAHARARHGRTLRRLSAATRIPEPVLRAMERDDFTACGGDFYARGHLRVLCAALGLDPDPLLRRYDTEHAAPPPRSAAEPCPADPGRCDRGLRRRRRAWTAAVLAAALALTFPVWPDHDPAPAAARHAAPAPADRSAAPTVPPAAEPVTLRVTAHRRTWVSVADATGTDLFTGVLTPGQTRYWSVPRAVLLRLGDAGGVRLWVNGRAHGTPGADGEVTRLSFTADTGVPPGPAGPPPDGTAYPGSNGDHRAREFP